MNGSGRWKMWILHLSMGAALPLTETFLLLSWIVLPEGYVFFGDTSPLPDPWKILSSGLSVLNYNSDIGTSSTFLWLPHIIVYWFVSSLIGAATASRVLTVVIAALPGCLMYLGTSSVAEHWLSQSQSKGRVLFSVVASQVYLLSFVNQGLWNPFLNPWTFSYAILPLVLAGFWIWVFHARTIGLVTLSLATIFSASNPFWIEAAIILIGPPFVACLLSVKTRTAGKVVALRVLIALCAVVLANFFWIVPLLVEYQIGTATYSLARVPLTFDGLLGASRGFGLLDVLLYGHSTYEVFGRWQQNWTLANLVPALFTYVPFLFARKELRRLVSGLGVSLLIGLFLAKGANPPLGTFFYEIGIRLPLGFGVFFRNGGNIFLEPVLAVASLLIGFAFLELLGILDATRKKAGALAIGGDVVVESAPPLRTPPSSHVVSVFRRARASFILLVLASVVLTPLAVGSIIDQQVYGPRFVATEIPSAYFSTNSFLQNRPGDFNVLWIPNGCCNVPFWKPHILTNFPAVISSRSVIPNPEQYLAYAHVPNSSVLSNWMTLLGVRYIIVHSDFQDYPWESWQSSLIANPDFELAYQEDFIHVYEVRRPWLPQKVYVLPVVGNYSDGFPRFEGTEFIEISHFGYNETTLNFPSGQDLTISSWIKTSNPLTQVAIQNNVYGGTWNGWVLGLWEGRPWFQVGQTDSSEFQGLVARTSVADGTWHFISGERNGTDWHLFVDGELVASKVGMASIPIESEENASIGARVTTYGGNTWFFDGSLANVQVYDRALADTEVGELYRVGMRVARDTISTYAPLLWALPFDDTLTSPQDQSGNGLQLVPFGTLSFGTTPLPLSVDTTSPRNGEVVSALSRSATNWMVQIAGAGQSTLILAEPYVPGWEASWSGRTAAGIPLFGGTVTAFNLTLEGPTRVELRYVYQNSLVAGSLASLLGYPAIVFAVSLRKRRSSIHA